MIGPLFHLHIRILYVWGESVSLFICIIYEIRVCVVNSELAGRYLADESDHLFVRIIAFFDNGVAGIYEDIFRS